MPAGIIPLGWKLGLEGAGDVKARLQEIHQEFESGKTNIAQYSQQKRELSRDMKALTNDFQLEQKAILASHPALLQLSQATSVLGSVSHTLLSVTSAINLAMIASVGYENDVSNLKIQRAGIENQLNHIRQQGLEDSAQYQILMGQEKEIDTEIANKRKEFAVQQIQNTITEIAAIGSIVSAIAQSAPPIIANINRMRNAWMAYNELAVGSALTSSQAILQSVTWLAGAVALPLAVAVGAFYGTYELIRALNPKYDESMKELEGILRNNWHVDSLTAFLVSPFVGAYLGFASIEDRMTENLYNFINSFINIIDTLPDAVNKAFGRVIIPRIDNILPPGFANGGQDTFYNQAIRDLNINKNGPIVGGAASGLFPSAFGEEQKNTTKAVENAKDSTDNLVNIWTSITNPTVQQMRDLSNAGNLIMTGLGTTLIDINANGKAQQQLAQKQLDAIQSQKDAQVAAIQILQDKIAELKTQPQTQPKYYTVTSPGSDYYGQTFQSGTEPTQAAKDLAAAQAALDKLKSQEVGTPQLLAGYLSGAGLSSTSGIGSIVTSALGLGDTSGWTAADVQKFIQTHDYGVFTAAAMRDNAPHTPTQQEQIQALLDAWKRNGLVGYTAADAARSLGYTPSNNSGSSNVGPGAFGGLPGQYGNPSTPASRLGNFLGPSSAVFGGLFAEGGEGLVSSPTMFMAGEKGSEYVSIKPLGRDSGRGGDINIYITLNTGSIIAERDLMDRIRKALKEDLKSSGFNR